MSAAPTQLSASLDKGKKELFRDTSASLSVSIFCNSGGVGGRSTLLEELRYAIIFKWGKGREKALCHCGLSADSVAPLPLCSHKTFKVKGSLTKKQKPTRPTVSWVTRSGTAC